MILKSIGLIWIAAAYMFAFAAPPVYPGAKPIDDFNASMRKAGQDHTAYNTFDPYEKVYAFYKSNATEQPPRHGRPGEKFSTFKSSDGAYGVSLIWKEDSKAKGTVIQIVKAPGR